MPHMPQKGKADEGEAAEKSHDIGAPTTDDNVDIVAGYAYSIRQILVNGSERMVALKCLALESPWAELQVPSASSSGVAVDEEEDGDLDDYDPDLLWMSAAEFFKQFTEVHALFHRREVAWACGREVVDLGDSS